MHNDALMPNDDTDALIGSDEARRILNYAKASSISRLVARGELVPVVKAPGVRGAFIFRRSDVEALAHLKSGEAA